MSLKSKIEAVIYASEEPVTLQQLASLLGGETQAELDRIASGQAALPLRSADDGTGETAVAEPEIAEQADSSLQEGEALRSEVSQPAAKDTEESSAEHTRATADLAAAASDEPSAAEQSDAGAESSLEDEKRRSRERERAIREYIRRTVDHLIREYAESDRGIEIREVASGYRMGTKPEYHDAVRGFVKSLKPALRLTLPALETLAVVAYKQPVTAAEISEIRGVDSAGVLGGLMTRKLIAPAGRKQVIGRPMLYKTTRDFLLRFGLKDVNELPSMEEFERMAGELAEQEDLPIGETEALIEQANARGDAERIREETSAGDATDDASKDAEVDDEAPPGNQTNKEATAESAAGGNDAEANEQQHTGETETGSEEGQQQSEEERAR